MGTFDLDTAKFTDIIAIGNKLGAHSISISAKGNVRFSTSPPRKKARAGDIKIKRGVRYVRQQQMSGGGYCVRNGRPQWEWVRETESREFCIQNDIRSSKTDSR